MITTEKLLRSFSQVIPEILELGFSLSIAILVGPYFSLCGVFGDAAFDWLRDKIGNNFTEKLRRKLGKIDGSSRMRIREIVGSLKEDPEIAEALLLILKEFINEARELPGSEALGISGKVKEGLENLQNELPKYRDMLNNILSEVENIERELIEIAYSKGIYYVKIRVGEDVHIESVPFIIGRYDPETDPVVEGPADCLAIKKDEKISKLFENTFCRYSCHHGDYDCTHRRHVEVNILQNEILIRNLGKMPVYLVKNGKQVKIDFRGIRVSERAIIYISGVYSPDKTKKVPVMLEFLGKRGRCTEHEDS